MNVGRLAIPLFLSLGSVVTELEVSQKTAGPPEVRRQVTRLQDLQSNTSSASASTENAASVPVAPPSGGCTMPDVPNEFIVASVPGRDGEFQVVHRLKSKTELKTKFSHYGHVIVKPILDKSAAKTLNAAKFSFQWNDAQGATVFSAKTDSLKPWKPLDVRDCNGEVVAAMTQEPAAPKTTFFKYSIVDGTKKEVGSTNPTDLKNDVLISDKSGATIARIHPELMGSHQTVTILAKEPVLSDPRVLIYIAANKGMARSKHAEHKESYRKKVALGFLSKICIAVGAVLLLAAVACALSCKYGLIDIGNSYTEDIEQQSLVKSRPAAAMSR